MVNYQIITAVTGLLLQSLQALYNGVALIGPYEVISLL